MLTVLPCSEVSQQSVAVGQERPIGSVRAMSAMPPEATKSQRCTE